VALPEQELKTARQNIDHTEGLLHSLPANVPLPPPISPTGSTPAHLDQGVAAGRPGCGVPTQNSDAAADVPPGPTVQRLGLPVVARYELTPAQLSSAPSSCHLSLT
jgi:hypothetical protein